MKRNSKRSMVVVCIAVLGLGASAVTWRQPARAPEQVEYLPAVPTGERVQGQAASSAIHGFGANLVGVAMASSAPSVNDFSSETVGSAPASFAPVVGQWLIGVDGDNKVLVVDGRKWQKGNVSTGLADQARALYGERYAEFLDNVTAYAYFPFAAAKGVDDFREGEISFRFKGVDGRIDQAAGILFDLKPNGDYLTLRANPLEDNLVLWTFNKGKRQSVKWVRNTPTPSRQWHELRLVVKGKTVEGYLNGKLYLTHTLEKPVAGKVGIWSKADSVVYFDDFTVKPAG